MTRDITSLSTRIGRDVAKTKYKCIYFIFRAKYEGGGGGNDGPGVIFLRNASHRVLISINRHSQESNDFGIIRMILYTVKSL